MHRILSRFQHIFVLIHNILSNPLKQMTTICPTKDDLLNRRFPLSQNSWSACFNITQKYFKKEVDSFFLFHIYIPGDYFDY